MTGTLSVRRWDDPRVFTGEAMPFLMRDEIANCLMASILSSPRGFQGEYLATVLDDGGLRGVAFRTPLKLLLSRMDEDAARAVAIDVCQAIPELNEVLGPRPEVDAFAATWSSLSGRPVAPRRSERIYQLSSVRQTPGVPGTMRLVRAEDRERIVPWIEAMARSVGDTIERSMAEESFDRHLDGQTLFLWENNQPVSMAAAAARSPNTRRVSLVYTPAEQRRRGYASALVAAVSQRVLDAGTRWCVLYTDLANPTTNHIYQEIGYQPVCDAQEYVFGMQPDG